MHDPRRPEKSPLQLRIHQTLSAHGALLGKELCEYLDGEPFLAVWQACFSDDTIQISHFSRYYLRFDITRADMVRLSPSILRDFLSFTLISLPGQRETVIDRQVELSNTHREISREKMRIARTVMIEALADVDQELKARLCAFIAGDLAYFLGHSEPREIKATGERVRGSDIDIIIVHDDLPDDVVEAIDSALSKAKYYYLSHPGWRQELDFIVKPIERMYDQFNYSDIHEKIASKIVYESLFLAGSVSLYGMIMEEMRASGAGAKIEADFEYGLADRKSALHQLLQADPYALNENTQSLFYFYQERVEFS
ncbi:MAG: hypothetical protein AAGJ32_08970 [Pseudomonadota bacterium]